MANELTIQVSQITFAKQGRSMSRPVITMAINVAGLDYNAATQTIGTVEETLVKGEVATVGVVLVKNLEPIGGNFVELGCTSGEYTVKVKPGETWPFRAAGNTIYAKADTAAVAVEFVIFPD